MHSLAVAGAPAVGSAAEGLLALGPALGWAVCAVLLIIYRRSVKKLLYGFADLIEVTIPLRGAPDIHILGGTAKWIKHQADNIDSLIGDAALYCEKATVYLLTSAWHLLLWQARELGDLAEAVERRIQSLVLGSVPKVVKQAIAPVLSRLHGIDRLLGAAEAQAQAQWARLHRGIDRIDNIITKTLPKAVAKATARVGKLEKTIAGWRAHPARLVGVLGAVGAVALFSVAIKRLGLRWLRCSNVKRAGRGVCGMDTGLLEDLLLGIATLGIGLNIVTFAEEMGEVVEDTASFITNRVT